MEKLSIRKLYNEEGHIFSIELSGPLVLSNSQQLKMELVNIVSLLSNQLKITISEPEEIDLSCIQLIVAFINKLDDLKIGFQFEWLINDEQRLLLENVGLINELYLSN